MILNLVNWMTEKSKTNRGMTTSFWVWKLASITGVVLLLVSLGDAQSPHNLIGCYKREFSYKEVKDKLFLGTTCGGIITVDACWGRCDSNEKGDYKPPYKISHHPVCTYSEIKYRKVRLSHCHPLHPDPYIEVFDAVRCECSQCASANTSCENLNG